MWKMGHETITTMNITSEDKNTHSCHLNIITVCLSWSTLRWNSLENKSLDWTFILSPLLCHKHTVWCLYTHLAKKGLDSAEFKGGRGYGEETAVTGMLINPYELQHPLLYLETPCGNEVPTAPAEEPNPAVTHCDHVHDALHISSQHIIISGLKFSKCIVSHVHATTLAFFLVQKLPAASTAASVRRKKIRGCWGRTSTCHKESRCIYLSCMLWYIVSHTGSTTTALDRYRCTANDQVVSCFNYIPHRNCVYIPTFSLLMRQRRAIGVFMSHSFAVIAVSGRSQADPAPVVSVTSCTA